MRASHENTGVHVLTLLLLLFHSSNVKCQEESFAQCLIGCDINLVECGIQCVIKSAAMCFIDCITVGAVDPALCIQTCGLKILQCWSSCALPVPFLSPGSEAEAPETSIGAAAASDNHSVNNYATSTQATALYLPLPPYPPPY